MNCSLSAQSFKKPDIAVLVQPLGIGATGSTLTPSQGKGTLVTPDKASAAWLLGYHLGKSEPPHVRLPSPGREIVYRCGCHFCPLICPRPALLPSTLSSHLSPAHQWSAYLFQQCKHLTSSGRLAQAIPLLHQILHGCNISYGIFTTVFVIFLRVIARFWP